jgi:hypothetical protein
VTCRVPVDWDIILPASPSELPFWNEEKNILHGLRYLPNLNAALWGEAPLVGADSVMLGKSLFLDLLNS